ncbi:MAG: methyltransferase domain-containing protein [Dehalococcoidia bacterium]
MARRRRWYVDLFRDVYPERWFEEEDALSAARTTAEVDFVEQSLELKPGSRVLDLCCGHGRHATELARRGYQVTGVDLSARALRRARRAAREAGADIHWQRCDMREIAFEEEFDAVINMFSSFGYLESDEEDRLVLERVRAALRPGGRFLVDFINRDWVIRRYQARDWRRAPDGSTLLLERRWDPPTGRNLEEITLIGPEGSRRRYRMQLRMYAATELAAMLASVGLTVRRIWGGFDGSELTLDSVRVIVLAEKAG